MNEWMRLKARVESSHLGRPRIMMAQGCAIRYVRIAASLLDGGRHFHGRLAVSGTLSSAKPRANGYGNVILCRVAVARIGKSAAKRMVSYYYYCPVARTMLQTLTTADCRMVGW